MANEDVRAFDLDEELDQLIGDIDLEDIEDIGDAGICAEKSPTTTDGLVVAAVEGSDGVAIGGAGSCHEPVPVIQHSGGLLPPSTNTEQLAGTSSLIDSGLGASATSDTDTTTRMEISTNERDDREDITTVLSRKMTLRKRLLRAEHHHAFLERCRKERKVPKGLKLNRQVHPIKGKGGSTIAANIEHIISRAERDIVDSLISHYEELGENITVELKNMETQLGSRPENDEGAVQSCLQTMEKEEDDLRSSLERTRNSKLRDLLKDTTQTPTRKGKGKFPKGGGPYLRKPKMDTRPTKTLAQNSPIRPMSVSCVSPSPVSYVTPSPLGRKTNQSQGRLHLQPPTLTNPSPNHFFPYPFAQFPQFFPSTPHFPYNPFSQSQYQQPSPTNTDQRPQEESSETGRRNTSRPKDQSDESERIRKVVLEVVSHWLSARTLDRLGKSTGVVSHPLELASPGSQNIHGKIIPRRSFRNTPNSLEPAPRISQITNGQSFLDVRDANVETLGESTLGQDFPVCKTYMGDTCTPASFNSQKICVENVRRKSIEKTREFQQPTPCSSQTTHGENMLDVHNQNSEVRDEPTPDQSIPVCKNYIGNTCTSNTKDCNTIDCNGQTLKTPNQYEPFSCDHKVDQRPQEVTRCKPMCEPTPRSSHSTQDRNTLDVRIQSSKVDQHPHELPRCKILCDNVMNLSGTELSSSTYSLLRKGLSFIPATRNNKQNWHKDLDNLKNKYLSKYTGNMSKRSSRLLQCCLKSIQYEFQNVSLVQPRHNLDRSESRSLNLLAKNKSLVVSKADKGDTTVIMNSLQYLDLAYKHLSDKETYQLLSEDPTQQIVARFNKYLEHCLEKRVIDTKQFNELYLPPDTDTQTIYFLPKIHKDPMKLRPIVSCTNGPTCTASAFIDRLLQPHMRGVKSYLKNSMDLIKILSKLKVPSEALLITLDIESLYTNISHSEAIVSFLRRFKSHPSKVFLLDLLKYVLKNNVFQFNAQFFTQLCGIAMGTKLAPALATVYIGDLEEAFIESRSLKPHLWVRYIDDVFVIWTHSRKDFDVFLADLNQRQHRIRFTAEISTLSCNFLDLTIYKPPDFESTGLLATKIYYKPTNTFSFPLGASYMPKTIHKSIAIGEMTRLLRNTSSPTIFMAHKKKLLRRFRRRGYPDGILKQIRKFSHNQRLQVLYRTKKKRHMERPLPFVTQFVECSPSLNRIFHKRWDILFSDPKFYSLLPNSPFTAFKNKKTLKSILSCKRRTFNTDTSQWKSKLGTQSEFKFTRFNSHKTRP